MREVTKIDWQNRVEAALVKLLDNIDSPLRFSETALELGASPFHFHRQFRKLTGETFKNCCSRIRLEKAMVMLRDSDRSITAIAYDCGYANSEMLSKSIRKTWGLTPTGLRSQRKWHPNVGSEINFHYLRNDEEKTWFYLNGGIDCMKTKIIEFESKTVYGYSCIGDFWKLPEVWQKVHKKCAEQDLYSKAAGFMSVFPDNNPSVVQEKNGHWEDLLPVTHWKMKGILKNWRSRKVCTLLPFITDHRKK